MRTRSLIVLASCLAFSLPAAPGTATTAADWASARAAALGRLDLATAGFSSRSLAAAVKAAAGLVGIEVEARSATAATVSGADPVSLLSGAVTRAATIASGTVAASPEAMARAKSQLAALDDGAADETTARRLDDVLAWVKSVVDREALYGAAVTLASAIDTAIPALSAGAPAPGSARIAEACDMVNQAPALCVSGSAAQIYDQDYALLIDLGGDDVYRNSAGGAVPLANALPVSVLVDVAGNDRYEASVPTASGATAIQGAGSVGGIGMLVDQAGNDVYAASATASSVNAQGTGLAGVGLLSDASGNDTYRLLNESPVSVTGGFSEAIDGQGEGSLGGTGLLLDRAGDDTYLARSNPVPTEDASGTLVPGPVSASGMGFGILGGVGVVSDQAGTDSMTFEAFAGPVAPDEPRPVANTTAIARGLGYASQGGAGLVLSGSGDTVRTARVEVATPRTSGVLNSQSTLQSLGYAITGGFAAVHDAGGDDSYRAEVVARAVRRVTVGDDCGCSGADAGALAGQVASFSMARASLGGQGILRDLSGDDRYVHTATAYAEAEARDERTRPGPDAIGPTATATASAATANGQGVGHQGAVGLLLDAGGNDHHESRATSESRATAPSLLAELAGLADASSISAKSLAQGSGDFAGYGELRDQGGNDTYVSINTAPSFAEPADHAHPGFVFSSVWGSVETGATGHFADVDGNAYQYDVFTIEPEDPVTAGTRGGVFWVDGGAGAGAGVNQ